MLARLGGGMWASPLGRGGYLGLGRLMSTAGKAAGAEGREGVRGAEAGWGEGTRPERDAEFAESDELVVKVGIVGAPNAGKSMLTNALVGGKVSAVSAKTNTTRRETLGAYTEGSRQMVLYDTPGVVGPEHYMNTNHQRAVSSAWKVAANCDVLLFLCDAHRQIEKPDPRVEELLKGVGEGLPIKDLPPVMGIDFSYPPSILVLNKIDLFPYARRAALHVLSKDLDALGDFDAVAQISALNQQGTMALRNELLSRAVPGRWLLGAGQQSGMTKVEQAVEITREHIFRRLHQDVPYEIEVRPVSFKPLRDGSLRVEQAIMCQSNSQRKIVVGKKGCVVGEIGILAGKDMSEAYGCKVHLILGVKVR